jgi:hypothetical protein
LVWLLSSSNRFMRDWVTKALIQLLRGHLDVARSLLIRFWDVDDPYLVQRVVVIAYGALMRRVEDSDEAAKRLINEVRRRVFTRPMRADELLLDAARGIVELGVSQSLVPPGALKSTTRPYGLAPPRNPPSKAALDAKYQYREGIPYEQQYASIYHSVIGMGDFGRYVIESGLRYFSRYRVGSPYPERVLTPEPKFIKSRWKTFVQSLNRKQTTELEAILEREAEDKKDARTEVNLLFSEFRGKLKPTQRELLSKCWRRFRPRPQNDEYPADRAKRWIVRRTIALGWTPDLFGSLDRVINYNNAREGHKAERWGKKYQWIAYHELLARIADNYQTFSGGFDDEQNSYEGLYQIIADREIDPSLPPIPYRDLAEKRGEGVPSWPASTVEYPSWPPSPIDFARFRSSDIDAFLAETGETSPLRRLLFVADEDGDRWLMLSGHVSQHDPKADKSWRGLQEVAAVDSVFASSADAKAMLRSLPSLRQKDHRALVDRHGHIDCCYFGELGWVPNNCSHKHLDFDAISDDQRSWRIAQTVEGYMWEGSLLDCSIGDSVSSAVPSSFLQSKVVLRRTDPGPSWTSENGQIVFTTIRGESKSGFLVRATWLGEFLATNQLELAVTSWVEHRLLTGGFNEHHPSEAIYSAVRIDADLKIHYARDIRERFD